MFFNFALSLSNRIGRLAKIPNAISAKESVVNLATPHWDEAKAIIDNCMEIPIYLKKYYQIILKYYNYLLKIIVFFRFYKTVKNLINYLFLKPISHFC